jgi:hypothetical protein
MYQTTPGLERVRVAELIETGVDIHAGGNAFAHRSCCQSKQLRLGAEYPAAPKQGRQV